MARNRHSVATTRWIITGLASFVGAFVLSFGFGKGQRVIMVIGGAMIVLGIAARYATRLRRNPRRWVTGTGQVVDVSDPPTGARFGRCTLQLVVDAPDMPAETVLVRHPRVPVALWPERGHELPIQVAVDDVRIVRILWKSYFPAGEPGPADLDPTRSDLADPDGEPAADSDLAAAEQRLGPDDEIDFDLDGPALAGPGTPPGGEGRVPRPRSGPPPGSRPGRRPSPYPRRRVPAAVGAGAAREGPDADAAEVVSTYPSAHPGPAGAIHGVGLTVLVTDLDRSATFYRDRLGFYEMDSGEGNLVLASGETRLVLRQVPEIGTVTRRLVHLNLEVTDIGAVYAELKAAGVRFTYPPRVVNSGARLDLWAAAFRDPDGHGVAITQWRPHAASADARPAG